MEKYPDENQEQKISTLWECLKISRDTASAKSPVKENKNKQL